MSSPPRPLNPDPRPPFHRRTITLIVLCVFSLGLSGALLGPSLPLFAALTGSDAAAVSWIATARGLGALLGAQILGRLFDRVDPPSLLALLLLLCVPLGWGIPQLPTLPLLVLLQLLFGVCDGALHVGANTLLLRRVASRPGPYLNALHAAFGLGATCGPFILGISLRFSDRMSGAYYLVAGVYLIVSILFFLFVNRTVGFRRFVRTAATEESDPHTPPVHPQSTIDRDDRATRFYFRATLLLFILYIIGEATISGWAAWYAIGMLGADRELGAWTTSIFWFGLTCGRGVGIILIRRVSASAGLAIAVLGALLSVGLCLILHDPIHFVIAVGCVGLMVGPIFPIALTGLGERVPLTGTRTGRVFAAAAGGGVIAPFLVGQLVEGAGAGAILVTVLATLALFGCGLIVREWVGRGEHRA